MYSTLVCFHPLNFNQYGASPSGEIPKVQLDAPTELKGKKYYRRGYGGVDSDSYKRVSHRRSLAIQKVH
jgi:hypothetical protein